VQGETVGTKPARVILWVQWEKLRKMRITEIEGHSFIVVNFGLDIRRA